MARTGINQFASVPSIVCGDPKTGEASQWALTRAGLLAPTNTGVHLCSASGNVLADRTFPICGGYVNSSGTFRGYKGTTTHTSVFEHTGLSTAGASTSVDKYVLSVRFALANHFGLTATTSTTGNGTMCGRIIFTLSSGGYTHQLYSVKTPVVTGGAATTETVTVVGEYAEYERHITGTLPAGIIPAIGAAVDARLLIQVSDMISEGSPTIPADTAFSFDGFADSRAYLGVLFYSLKIYNEG